MGEKINFPKNYETFFKKGIQQFQAGNLEEACLYFKSAYAIKKEPLVNTMYVSALYQLGDYLQAKEIADDIKEHYQKDENLYGFYTSLLIKNQLFVEAERIIQKHLLHQENRAVNPVWETAQLELEKERNKVEKEKVARAQELVKNILAMGGKSFQYQSSLVKQMGDLEVGLYSLSAKSILGNPFVNEIIKSTVLEGLIQQNSHEKYELYWFKENRMVVPAHVTSIEENETVKQMLTLLRDQFEDTNPTLYQMLMQEINLQFLFLHPYIDEVVTDVTIWLDLCLKRYGVSEAIDMKEESEYQVMSEWIERLGQKVENMI